jgi:hypothetical protein
VSDIPAIAEAIVTALNGHAFSQPFTAERAYLVERTLPELATLRVTVAANAVEMTTAGRGLAQEDIQIDVAIRKRVDPADNAEMDALMRLVAEIANFIRATGRFNDAAWVKTENMPIYSPEHLGELRQFTSVLTLTLRVMQA